MSLSLFSFHFLCFLALVYLSYSESESSTNNGPYSDPSNTGYGLTFSVDSPPQLKGLISFLPYANCRSPLGNLTGELVLPNSHDSPTGCDASQNQAAKFTPYRDNGLPFTGTILLLQFGVCPPDFSGLNISAAIFYNPQEDYDEIFFFSESCYTPILNTVSFADMSLIVNYLYLHSHNNVSSGDPIIVTITGTDPLVSSERKALMKISETLNYSSSYADNSANTFGDKSTPLNAYPPIESYDPCTDFHYLGGIYCQNGHVVFILLQNTGLIGTLPPEFGLLSQLVYVEVGGNAISGPLPDDICNLRQLFFFSVRSNEVTNLPDCFDALKSLSFLLVNGNQITSFPKSVLNTTLRSLDFSANKVDFFPSLSVMTSLVNLVLSNNNASGVFFCFHDMNKLRVVDLRSNRFSGQSSASCADNLPLLTHFDLSYNNIEGPLPTFSQTTHLTYVALDNNMFYGDCPSSWSLLTSMFTLTASHNKITCGVNGSSIYSYPLSNLPSLQVLDLSSNLISAPSSYYPTSLNGGFSYYVSDAFGAPKLNTLKLDNNQLSGEWTFGAVPFTPLFPSLNFLSLSHNNITTLPFDVFFWGLLHLDASYNALTGSIPALTAPPVNFAFLSLVGNPDFSSPLLPSWISLSSTSYHSLTSQPYSCPDFLSPDHSSMTINLDASYDLYHRCVCDRGYFNFPPHCSLIPSIINTSSSYGEFTDEEFGDQRYSSGVDSSWLIVPTSGTRVINLNITIYPSVFNSDTDQLTVYSDKSSSSIVRTWSGNEVQGDTFSVFVPVISAAVQVNFKSKRRDGQHFSIHYSSSTKCPDSYQTTETACELIDPPSIGYVIMFIAVAVSIIVLIFFVGYLVYRTVALRRKLKMTARSSAKIPTEQKWRDKLVKDIAKETVSMGLDVGTTISSFTVMMYLIDKNANAISRPFIDGYIFAFISSTASMCISFYFRIRKMIILLTEWKRGVPTYHIGNDAVDTGNADDESGKSADTGAGAGAVAVGILRVNDPRVQLASAERELLSLRLIIFSTLFSTLPYFILNHILLLFPPDPTSLTYSGTSLSLYFSIFLTYTLLGFKVSQLLEWRVLLNQKQDLTFLVKSNNVNSEHYAVGRRCASVIISTDGFPSARLSPVNNERGQLEMSPSRGHNNEDAYIVLQRFTEHLFQGKYKVSDLRRIKRELQAVEDLDSEPIVARLRSPSNFAQEE